MCRELITITEAAKRVGVSRVTMQRAVSTGKYKREKINRRALLVWKCGRLLLDEDYDAEE